MGCYNMASEKTLERKVTQKNLKNELWALRQFNKYAPIVKARHTYDIGCDNQEYFQRNVLMAIDIAVLEELYPEMIKYRDIMKEYVEIYHLGDGVANKVMRRDLGNLYRNIEFLEKYLHEKKRGKDD